MVVKTVGLMVALSWLAAGCVALPSPDETSSAQAIAPATELVAQAGTTHCPWSAGKAKAGDCSSAK